ncbi:Cupredoxin [Aspergillus varians]
MLSLRSLLCLICAVYASASWDFSHDFDSSVRSLLSEFSSTSTSHHDRRQDSDIAGRPGGSGTGGTCRPGDRDCSSRPTHTRTTTSTAPPTATPCAGNTPDTRSSWCNYSIDTNYHDIIPDTGVTREYWLEIDEIIAAPDGVSRPAMAINGTIPGPTLYADWGDEVVIHVRNLLHETLNGTSIHWHGIRQQNNNQNDGVVSITQCPITPNHEYTYRWRAQQYGTSWYHSHMGLQAWDGVAGGLVINGPATENYDVDAGTIMLGDWPHQTADELSWYAQTVGPPTLNNSLINGTNVYGSGDEQTGERFTMKVEEGTSYRLRIINAAIDTHYRFGIDNHRLTVIAMDLVPIEPFTTDYVTIAMGQRYDVIVTANQSAVADSFWLRSIPQIGCSDIEDPTNIKGIFHYGDTLTTPDTSPWLYATENCDDMPMDQLVPHISRSVQPPDWEDNVLATLGSISNNSFRWFLNSTTMEVFWEDPTLLQIAHGETKWANSSAVIDLPKADEWVYLVVSTTRPIAHPIHLHGHDFFILAQGASPWDGTFETTNPPRRDTAVLPGNGFLVMAWETDNPGAWLMHCHIGWHVSEGFALQFVERQDAIKGLIDQQQLKRTCNVWNGYDEEYDIEQHDSGV